MMKMNKWKKLSGAAVLAVTLGLAAPVAYVHADDTMGEKAGEAAKDTGRAVKKGARAVQDKSCELVNGKMECAGKKLKNKAKNTVDKVEDATD